MVTGAGTSNNPYILSSLSDLEQISVLGLNKYYRLGSDIDASATADPSYNDGAGWNPLGTFTGNFNCNGYKIIGLYINRPETDNVGFFSQLNVSLSGFTLEDVDITGKDHVGGIAGYKGGSAGVFTSCSVGGNITGNNNVGGIAGYISSPGTNTSLTVIGDIVGHDYVGGLFGGTALSRISVNITTSTYNGNIEGNSYVGGIIGRHQSSKGNISSVTVKGVITATGDYVGGVAGEIHGENPLSNIIITNELSINTVGDHIGGIAGYISGPGINTSLTVNIDITGHDYVGGLFGGTILATHSMIITNSSYNGNIEGNNYVGGIIGIHQTNSGNITTSYTYGSITATGNYAGGIAGYTKTPITNSYSFMTVTGNQHTGGLIGSQGSGLITNSYSIGRVTGTTNTGGLVGSKNTGTATDSYWNMNKSTQGTSALGTGKTQSEMKDEDTYSTWDTTTVWQVHPMIQGAYPFLRGNHHVDVEGFQDDTIGPPLVVYIDKIKVDDGTTVGGYDDDTYRNKLKAQNTPIVVSGVKKSLAAILECDPSVITVETVASKTVVVTVPVGHDLDEITDYLDGLFLAGVGYTVESES